MTINAATTNEATTVHGTVEAGFEAVREAFEGNFSQRGEQGAACAIYVDGTKVVDLWGGLADHMTGRPWTEDTLSVIWSATKGAVGVLLNLLAQRRQIDLDLPVADYWPEFAQNGKDKITVRMILNHQAGLPVIDESLTMDELLAVTPVNERLARQAPVWTPGADHGYHAFTYGFLLSEVVGRVTGRSLGQVFAEEVAAPLGLDFWIGLPAEHEHRVTRLIDVSLGDTNVLADLPMEMREPGEALFGALADPASLSYRALHPSGVGFVNADLNNPRAHQAEWAFGGGICNAQSLARLYAACVGEVDGIRLLSEQTLAEATAEQTSRPDRVLWYPTRWGTGFMLPNEFESWLGRGSFAFAGAGGHLGLGDAEMRVGLGYTMTKMGANLTGDCRPAAVIAALRKCLR